jgi:hypothetical protein
MHAYWVTLLGAAVVAAVLYLFYFAIHTEWPTHYVSIGADLGVVVNRSISRYLAFRTVPTYLICLLVATTCSREGGHGLASALIGAAIQTGRTNVRHLAFTWRRNHDVTRLPIMMVDGSTILLTLGAAALGGLGTGSFDDVVPRPD